MTKTNEEIYKLSIDFLVNAIHGSTEETGILADEVKLLQTEQFYYFFGLISGFICAITNHTDIGKFTEPMLREFLNQRYLDLKKEGAFNDMA